MSDPPDDDEVVEIELPIVLVKDVPEFVELIQAFESGAMRIVQESKCNNAKFWAGRILNRLKAFNGKS